MPDNQPSAAPDKSLTFFEHLSEFRRALTVSGIAVLAGFGVAVFFSDFLDWLIRLPIEGILPAGSDEPVFLGLFDPIFYRLKLAIIGGLVLASPVVFWQLWWFISPALYPKEKRYALPFIFTATLFFMFGVLFCYFVILPQAAAFSVGQLTDKTRIILSLQTYLSQAGMFLLAFGLVFETPILVFLLSFIGLIKAKTFAKFRKWVFLGCFVVSAVITPTVDAFNQGIVALPMYVLFEVGVLAARLVEGRKRKAVDPAG